MNRRSVLKAGFAGTVLLSLAGVGAVVLGRNPVADRQAVLGAVIPAILDGALPPDGPARASAIAAAAAGTVAAMDGLAPHARAELGQLFALLASTPGRLVLAGVRTDWPRAELGEVAAFLQRWRTHPTPLFRTGYLALHDLVAGPWYADERNWPAIGYGGPLNI